MDNFEDAPIIGEDADYRIFAKPPGVETISADGGADFAGAVRRRFDESGLAPVHRLDRDTSGALLFARNPAAERRLVDLFRRREVAKTYLALCLGIPRNRTGTVRRNLSEWSGGRRPVRVVKRGGLAAETDYRVLAGFAPDATPFGAHASLIAFSPRQGRTHQIRVHAAALGYPILGDDQYGDRPANRPARTALGLRRQALHSWRLGFPWREGMVSAICPLPPDMEEALHRLTGRRETGFVDGLFDTGPGNGHRPGGR